MENNRVNLSGFHRGIVLAHGENGKCKIFWPGIFPSTYNNKERCYELPDSEQASPLFASGCLGNGTFFYPEVGTVVWGFFENEDINKPVYFASVLVSNVNSSNYSDLFKDDAGESLDKLVKLIKIDNLEISMNRKNGSLIIKNNNGTIDLKSDGSIDLKSNNNITINGKDIKIEASNDLNISAKNMNTTISRTIETYSQFNRVRTKNGGTSIKGDDSFYSIYVV